jgi:hypothetical protein
MARPRTIARPQCRSGPFGSRIGRFVDYRLHGIISINECLGHVLLGGTEAMDANDGSDREEHTGSKGVMGGAGISSSRLRRNGRVSGDRRFAGFLCTLLDDPLAGMLRSMLELTGVYDSPISGEFSLPNRDAAGGWPNGHGSLYAGSPSGLVTQRPRIYR